MENINNLKKRVTLYKEILANTKNYRKTWNTQLKNNIIDTLKKYAKEVGLDFQIEVTKNFKNLEAITFSLKKEESGIYEIVNRKTKLPIIKFNGMLAYQQLFNGKINVLIIYPVLEGLMQPKPPKQIAIYRPEEISEAFLVMHLEEFIKEMTEWEDFDDDEHIATIGFNHPQTASFQQNTPKNESDQ